MNSSKMTISDLLSDESFINYCKNSSPEDVAFWDTYTLENPGAQLLILHAKEEFVNIFNALAINDLKEQSTHLRNKLSKVETPVVPMLVTDDKKSKNIFYFLKISAAVAAVLAIVLIAVKFYAGTKKESMKSFEAAYGERKDFQLPDGSVVTLNGGSKIQITESFGVSSRDIYLEGEAFFDVKHNKALPFIVHTPAMDVRALGTAFNVKAYPGEKITETSLLRGIVEVTLKEANNRKMLLHPNQKIFWEQSNQKGGDNNSALKNSEGNSNSSESLLKRLNTTETGDIKEIAWKENKLIFDNESFDNIAVLLERWYGVKITIKDDVIRNKRFTGTFDKEELSTVLNFLKESMNFNYEIEHGETLKINIFK